MSVKQSVAYPIYNYVFVCLIWQILFNQKAYSVYKHNRLCTEIC